MLTSVASYVVFAPPTVSKVGFLLPDQPGLREVWEPGVLAVEYGFTDQAGPTTADVIVTLYHNASVRALPYGVEYAAWETKPSEVVGGTPLATVVIPAGQPDGETGMAASYARTGLVAVENVARPFGVLRSGDTLALQVMQATEGAEVRGMDFRATLQGDRRRADLNPQFAVR